MKRILLLACLVSSCAMLRPKEEVDVAKKDEFVVNLDLWLKCRTMCGGAGKNWAVTPTYCVCKRGIQIEHGEK